MAGKFHHEELYRGETLLQKLQSVSLTVCGVGALGSHLVDHLTRQGAQQLRVIDFDRIEEHNVNTQLYGEGDVGAWKGDTLRNHVFRSVGVEIETFNKELTEKTAKKFLKDSDLVLETFDNSVSRALVQEHCREQKMPCLHVGLFEDYCEVVWNEHYRVPDDAGRDVCDYPLARNLVLLAVVLTSEILFEYLQSGTRWNRTATLKDFSVRELEVPGS